MSVRWSDLMFHVFAVSHPRRVLGRERAKGFAVSHPRRVLGRERAKGLHPAISKRDFDREERSSQAPSKMPILNVSRGRGLFVHAVMC